MSVGIDLNGLSDVSVHTADGEVLRGGKVGALNKAIYSTLRDSIEANVAEEAKELLNREQHVN